MKILVYSSYVPNLTDGVSRSARRLVSALERKGVDVTVVTTDIGWKKEEILNQKYAKLNIFKALAFRNADFSPGLFLYLKKHLKEFDVVQFYGTFNFPTVVGAHIAEKKKIPYIICPAGNVIPSVSTRQLVRNAFLKSMFFSLSAKRALNNAAGIICTSVKEKEDTARNISNRRIECIGNGIEHAIYCRNVDRTIIKERLGVLGGKKYLLFLGRLSYEKRIPFLFDVFEKIHKKMPEIMLVIAGGGPKSYASDLLRRRKRLKCRENIILAGEVTGDLKLALLQHSQCLLLPSYFESFGIVVLESLVSGKPVVASTGTPWKVLEEKGFGRWLPCDEQVWADAIEELLFSRRYQCEDFFRCSREWVIENYDWQDTADRYIAVYERILKRNQSLLKI